MLGRLIGRIRRWMRTCGAPSIAPGERPLLVFISSVMNDELRWAREETIRVFTGTDIASVWAFERTPGSSEPLTETYLRKVRESDLFIWLVGEVTTEPVACEVREALESARSFLVVKLPASRRDAFTESLLAEISTRVKWIDLKESADLPAQLELTVADEMIRAMRRQPGLGRVALLQEMGRASRARCIERFQAAGLARAEAVEFADDPTVGTIPTDLLDPSARPVAVLVGEL